MFKKLLAEHLISVTALVSAVILLSPRSALSHADMKPAVQDIFLRSGGAERTAKMYLPSLQVESHSQLPLVILLHGSGVPGQWEDKYLGFSDLVNARQFALLIPEGSPNVKIFGLPDWDAMPSCCLRNVDDVGFLLALIDHVKTSYPFLDPGRISLFGHSAGGYMANRLACEEGSEFHRIGSLAGGSYKSREECKRQTPVSYLHIHAVDDTVVSYVGGVEYSGGTELVGQWLLRDRCSAFRVGDSMDLVTSIPGLDTDTQSASQCANGTQVQLWSIRSSKGSINFAHIPMLNSVATGRILDFLLAK